MTIGSVVEVLVVVTGIEVVVGIVEVVVLEIISTVSYTHLRAHET